MRVFSGRHSKAASYKIDKVMEKLVAVTEIVENRLPAGAVTPATPEPRTPQQIPTTLSREVKRIHKSLEDGQKYRGNERFASEHNSSVTNILLRTITDEEEYDPSLIRRACNRYFENIRRELKLSEDNKVEEDRRAKALNNRRHRLLNSRRSAARSILTDEEYKYLEGAPACTMSDEETDSENKDIWKVYPPEWRATRLTEILERCQCHLTDLHRRVPSGTYSQRQRPRGIKPIYLK
ncbi:uncharacterized protein LOC121636412 [Melanotaenia boesemani]|uniref:uncharacterized protein LOC121636412 n=1 Tax=Melanotaenia boesemani TaxID=1250792 RepID=UPI001C050AC0|nr:uncharacterized protein LOC121636412 [Melanotaenia boesemani]